jgi:hypothetical protein
MIIGRLSSTTAEHDTAVENCMATVKQHDFDNYLAGLLLPKKYVHIQD